MPEFVKMVDFTNIERTDMVLLYGEAKGIAHRAREYWIQRFPDRRIPSVHTFVNTVQHLRDYGSFKPQVQDRGRDRTDRVVNIEPQILERVEEEPGISTRRLALEVGVSHSVVHRTLKEQGLHPYHVQKVQALLPRDRPRRINFCQWLLEQCAEVPDFLNNVLFCDEAGFTRNGVYNVHNTHIWSDENPKAIRETHFQQQFSINVWAGILGNRLIGPIVLPNRLTGNDYLQFLSTTLEDLLDEEVPLATRRWMWLLHDGAPPHYARQVAAWLDENFPNRWIGRNGPVRWPPRSPDLTPCDFFLWGWMKQIVYATPVNTVEELRRRVITAAQTMNEAQDSFARVRDNIRRRAEACITSGGRHFEHLL